MFKTLYNDFSYLENKYHKTDEPFNPYRRMNYHGYDYDPSTGLSDEEMKSGLSDLSEKLKGLPHPIAKARLFSFVLDNARIDVNEKDWFVGFYNWGRPITEFTVYKWEGELYKRVPSVKEKIDDYRNTGTVAIWPDFDHVIPDWESLLNLGFRGLLERVEKYHETWKHKGITPEQDAFFQGIEISYKAVLRLINRYCEYAETKTHEKAKLQHECLCHLRNGKPENLYEALQAIYIFFIVCECVDHYQTRSLGNGIDSTLLPFFENDIKSGIFTKDEEREFIAYFLMQFSAIGNYWGHPMYLGGTDRQGNTKYNEVSDIILGIYKELKIYNPKVQIKVSQSTPPEILNTVFDLIRNGISSFVFCCEPGFEKAMMGYGVSPGEARDFEISGCYETRVKHNESSTVAGHINAVKAMELVFHNGKDFATGKLLGIKTGEVEGFKTFDDFYFAYIKQWEHLIESTMEISNSYEGELGNINPSNLYSATVENSLRLGVDGYSQGLKYNNSCVLNVGFATAVDSVMAVKKLCFDKQITTLSELKCALDNNWKGYEKLRHTALNLSEKYGAGDKETDTVAGALSRFFTSKVNGRPNVRGGVYKAVMQSDMEFIRQGEKTAASPDGRFAGTELSKNGTPVSGMDKNGVTAAIHSALALVPTDYRETFCLDIILHPTTVSGDDGLKVMTALLDTYLKGGGMAIQFNIFDADTLRDAQKNPEKYKSMQVRVAGWNVLWNNLSEKEQNAYIIKAETAGG